MSLACLDSLGMNAKMPSLIDQMPQGRADPHHRPWARAMVDAPLWEVAARKLGHGRLSLLDLWGEPAMVHMAVMDEQTAAIDVLSLECPERKYPSVGRHHPPALRLERYID